MSRRAVHWLRTGEGKFRRAASLPVTDRGFRYGMAVFETIGVRDGRAMFLAEHLQSGLEACQASGFPVDEAWFRQAGEFLTRNLPGGGSSGVARLHVTAGDGAPADPVRACRMLVTFEPRSPLPAAVYARGYRLGICPAPFAPTLGGRKTHNYWPNVAALQAARAAGEDESLVFNAADQLVSACMANVFVVLESGGLVTPALQAGGRPGIVRDWVRRNAHVRECLIERSDLRNARELFLTSSWLGIMPVCSVAGREFKKRAVSDSLMSKYHC